MTPPNHIWCFWDQGENQAPPLVRRCIASWRQHNPRWQLCVLDRESLAEYVSLPREIDITRKDLTVQKVSNLVRLYLLRTYGGVWADATLFCSEPLDSWLPQYFTTGFFAFRSPKRDRLMANWFLAANANNPLLIECHARYRDLFRDNYYTLQNTATGSLFREILRHFLSRNVSCTRLWISWPVRKLLRVYPYFNFHYTCNSIILRNGEPARIWNEANPFSANDPLFVGSASFLPDGSSQARDFILSRRCPLHKLNKNIDLENEYWREVFNCFSSLHNKQI